MIRITNLSIVYNEDGTVNEFNLAVDNNATKGSSVSANLVIEPSKIDLTSILEVCKQKLQEAVTES